MRVLLLALLCACSSKNPAVVLAHQYDPCAQCNEVDSSTATCTRGDEVWYCTASGYKAQCEVIAHRPPDLFVAETCSAPHGTGPGESFRHSAPGPKS